LKELDPEPFLSARRGIPAVSILFSETDGSIYKIAYAPVNSGGSVVGVMAVEASVNFTEGLNDFAKVLFSSGLVCILIMGGMLYAFGRRFISPIGEMARASVKIAEGDFSPRVRVASFNELGALAHAFNEMAKRLQSHNEYILESMSNGLLVVDLGGIITTFNKAASRILEIPQKKVVGESFETAFSKYPVFLAAIHGLLREKHHLAGTEIHLSDDPPKILRLRSAPLLGADSQELGVELLFTDETQVRKLEAQIKTAEKMATIGELAAGIAHEIRNPLGAMKGFTEILQKRMGDRPDAQEIVADIASEIEILNKIVTNFLVFAKPTSVESQETELGDAVRSVLPWIEKEAEQKKVGISFKRNAAVHLRLDTEQFRRAVLNIALNAVQASPPGGKVTLEISGLSRRELVPFLSERGLTGMIPPQGENAWACLEVKDEGSGLAPENLEKIFTPFFTTKTEGFGLGLPITRKILESHGGFVGAANRRERGALFLVLLPALKKEGEVGS
jgi:nitrogen fixation/metabolism regulation signal transduction histidine kinase